MSINSFGAKVNLEFNSRTCQMFDINKVEGSKSLPFSLKILLENLLRTEDGINVTKEHINAVANWDENAEPALRFHTHLQESSCKISPEFQQLLI